MTKQKPSEIFEGENSSLKKAFDEVTKGRLLVQNYRDMHAPGFTEWICKHGVGHHKGIHGCCSCCLNAPKELWDKVTQD